MVLTIPTAIPIKIKIYWVSISTGIAVIKQLRKMSYLTGICIIHNIQNLDKGVKKSV